MKRIGGILLLLMLFCNSEAQSYRVQRASAFFTASAPGMIMKDDHGNTITPQPAIERFIYLECNYDGRPSIDSVLYNGILFSATILEMEKTSVDIGIKKDNGESIKLTSKKGNHIWKIELQQSTGKPLPHEVVKNIIIKGKLDKQMFSYKLYTETELSAPDRY